MCLLKTIPWILPTIEGAAEPACMTDTEPSEPMVTLVASVPKTISSKGENPSFFEVIEQKVGL